MIRRVSFIVPLVIALGCDNAGNGIEPLDNLPGRDVTAYEDGWASFGRVVGVPNLDDDNEDGTVDWNTVDWESENDMAQFVIPAGLLDNLNEGAQLELAFGGDTENVRLWLGSDVALPLEEAGSVVVPAGEGEDVVYWVEFGDYLASADLSVLEVDQDGAEIRSQVVHLLGSPAIASHHLQTSNFALALTVSQGGGGGVVQQ